ncbi:SEC-C metal-binding domain-containing protein [Sporosarcina sp. FA9]
MGRNEPCVCGSEKK